MSEPTENSNYCVPRVRKRSTENVVLLAESFPIDFSASFDPIIDPNFLGLHFDVKAYVDLGEFCPPMLPNISLLVAKKKVVLVYR